MNNESRLYKWINNLPDKPVASMFDWYRSHVKSPLATSLILGLGTAGVTRLAWGPVVETIRSLGRPFRKKLKPMLADGKGRFDYDKTIDEIKENSEYRWKIPMAFGLIAAGLPLYANYDKRKQGNGLLSYDAPFVPAAPSSRPERGSYYNENQIMASMPKTASWDMFSDSSAIYTQDLDWQKPIPVSSATSMFSSDPHFQNDPYTRQMGLSIINNAAIQQQTNSPTLGGIFDSAADKIEKKLTLGGIASVGVKTVVANGAARLFAGALDAVCDLSPSAKRTIIDAGTWAGAITSILN